jgi:hypothetical protein
MTRHCEFCGVTFAASRRDARFCRDACRKRARRRGVRLVAQLDQARRPDDPLVAAYRAELERVGLLDTWRGVLVLILARHFVMSTGSGAAALSRELSRVMAEALRRAPTGPDPLDELRARWDAKRGAPP